MSGEWAEEEWVEEEWVEVVEWVEEPAAAEEVYVEAYAEAWVEYDD